MWIYGTCVGCDFGGRVAETREGLFCELCLEPDGPDDLEQDDEDD